VWPCPAEAPYTYYGACREPPPPGGGGRAGPGLPRARAPLACRGAHPPPTIHNYRAERLKPAPSVQRAASFAARLRALPIALSRGASPHFFASAAPPSLFRRGLPLTVLPRQPERLQTVRLAVRQLCRQQHDVHELPLWVVPRLVDVPRVRPSQLQNVQLDDVHRLCGGLSAVQQWLRDHVPLGGALHFRRAVP
jgi:hypothetical protein